MGTGRSRRIAGVVVLAAALVLAFLVAHGASFPQAGHPVAAWPQPPAVGTCQELDDTGLRTVSCSEPHGLEVTKAWQAVDTLPTDLVTACGAAADAYLGNAANPGPIDGWQPDTPHYSAYQWSAPPADVVGARGWTVCVIGPWRPSEYTGSVRGLTSPAERPAAYGMCGLSGKPTLLPCDQAHAWEQLGQATADATAEGDQGVAQAIAAHQDSCRSLAASLIGVVDPTYGDRLRIVVDGQRGFSVTISDQGAGATSGPSATSGTWTPPGKPAKSVIQLTCQVLDVQEQLMGSLMGLGSGPLPVK